MRIFVNEIERETGGTLTAGEAAQRFKPDSDLLIINGFPANAETPLVEGDRLVLIRRGETPDRSELESLMVARHTPGVHAAVQRAHVGIAGLGGLGSQVAISLARLGIGRLTLADFDLVEPSNLNRQNYFLDQLGMPKATALGETLARINPFVKLDLHITRLTPLNIPEIFGGATILVEAFDAAGQKAMLVDTALARLEKTIVVAASGLAGYGPSETIRTHWLGKRLAVVGDLTSEARPGTGLMAPRVGVAANAQANLVLRIILGEEPGRS